MPENMIGNASAGTRRRSGQMAGASDTDGDNNSGLSFKRQKSFQSHEQELAIDPTADRLTVDTNLAGTDGGGRTPTAGLRARLSQMSLREPAASPTPSLSNTTSAGELGDAEDGTTDSANEGMIESTLFDITDVPPTTFPSTELCEVRLEGRLSRRGDDGIDVGIEFIHLSGKEMDPDSAVFRSIRTRLTSLCRDCGLVSEDTIQENQTPMSIEDLLSQECEDIVDSQGNGQLLCNCNFRAVGADFDKDFRARSAIALSATI